jgi:tRNA(Ile)-lysidine synthase TilS/MesJ
MRSRAEEIIRQHEGLGASYDIALAFSGGKDSTYTLKYLREQFDARVIAITIDNGFVSEVARTNCLSVTAEMGVDHIMFRPDPRAMMSIYNASLNKDLYSMAALKRATSICNSCIQVINTQLLNFAANIRIPIVAGGYLGGQIPSQAGFMKQNLTVTSHARKASMNKLEDNFDSNALRLLTQNIGDEHREIYVINPMAYLNLSEEEILEAIKPLGWIRPPDTGASSTNCLLNDYGIDRHMQKHGFHPYIAEIATMVRRGTISREEGLAKARARIDTSHFKYVEKQLYRFV